jgi:hypothetical protein
LPAFASEMFVNTSCFKYVRKVDHSQKVMVQVFGSGNAYNFNLSASVADPDVFGPPGSGSASISQTYGSGS